MSDQQSQVASNVGVLFLTLLFAGLAWVQEHKMMRHGLFAAATWTGEVFTMRLVTAMGWLTLPEVRLYNGWFAWLIGGVLIATWVTTWYVERREG